VVLLGACGKDEYYVDGGLANPVFDGDVLEYLESNPVPFDTIAQIVKLAGLEKVFRSDEFTFFAPRDENIKEMIGTKETGGVNRMLYSSARDTIKTLADVDSTIWRKYLERYMFKGKNKLKDYPQIDFKFLSVYGGQNFYSYNKSVSNIGVVFGDAASIKYVGYRQLTISYIGDISDEDSWITQKVSSSDVQPTNGVVHVLDYTTHFFGFEPSGVRNDIWESKR
jgi:hypothetical protein